MRCNPSRVWLRDLPIVALVTLASITFAAAFGQASFHESPFVHVVIEKGLSYAEIADRVKASGMIKDENLFLVLGRLFGIEHRAKAGRYRFAATANMVDILKTLYRGATYRERVLIRPGMTVDRIAWWLGELAAVDSVGFAALARDSLFVRGLGVPSKSAEGYLYPDTYDIEWQESPESVLRRMVGNFFRAFDETLTARAAQIGMTVNEVVTLASIIEKEAMLEEERSRISAVFHNRLRIGMKLQADPTVRYALKKWTGRVLYKDLEVDSPFNTYAVHGLPPHPICNPSLASLAAALHPLPDSKDLYFVAQGDGSHHFSPSAGEHKRATVRYRNYIRSIQIEEIDDAPADQTDGQGSPDRESLSPPG